MSIGAKQSYTAGHFSLSIDGEQTRAYLKSVDGGWAKHSVVDEPTGAENMRIKHAAVAEIDPVSCEFGLAGAGPVLKWIQGSWQKKYGRRSGEILHANFNMKQTFEHQFSDALITETTFPALDGGSKEAGYIKVKFQPEAVKTKKSPGSALPGNFGSKQKLWLNSCFRLVIDGIDDMRYTNKIESFTIKQGVKKIYTGVNRFPQIEPTKLDFPNIVGTISAAYSDGLLEWHEKYVQKGQQDTKAQKTGAIEFLSPDKAKTIFRINLFEIGLQSLQMSQSTANSDQIKRMKFELYVGRMELDVMTGFE